MTEPLPESRTHEPIEPAAEIARKNILLGLALLGIVLLMAAGAVVVSFVYLQYD
jgi:hypothetical protein